MAWCAGRGYKREFVKQMNNKIEKHGKNKGGNPNWVKGVSGNPNGRPKKIASLTSEMKEQLAKVCPYDQQGRTWLQYLVERWLAHSIQNAGYFRELIERLEGKVTQPIEAEVKADIHWTIGKGYAGDRAGIQPSK